MNGIDPAGAEFFNATYMPVFLEKLAAAGVPLEDQASVDAALETVSILKEAIAQDSGNIVKSAHSALCKASGVPTMPQRSAVRKEQSAISKIASSSKVQGLLAQLAASQ